MESNDDHKDADNCRFKLNLSDGQAKKLKSSFLNFNDDSIQPIRFCNIPSDELLEKKLADAIKKQDYEEAAVLRDQLKTSITGTYVLKFNLQNIDEYLKGHE